MADDNDHPLQITPNSDSPTPKPTPSSCEVCTEKFNKTVHKKVTCIYCSFNACRKCCEFYILMSIRPAECMDCKKEWSREFLVENFTGRFNQNEYKNHREKILFEKEKAILPRTQAIIERQRYEENLKRQIEELEAQANFLRREYTFLRNTHNERAIENGENGRAAASAAASAATTFNKKCPNEMCKGFLNATTWRCGLCDTKCCKECHEVIRNDEAADDLLHECKPEDVASAKLIQKDSKPCPQCGVLIYKAEGCSQMWCTQCHVAFDWKTGQIERNNIHNPHYYEYLRRTSPNGEIPRNPLDVVGGEACAERVQIINDHFVRTIMFFTRHHKGFRKEEFPTLFKKKGRDEASFLPAATKFERAEYVEMCRHIIHIREVEIRRLSWGVEEGRAYEDFNRDLRIRYLSNRISEEAFRSEIQKRDKSKQKKRDLINVLQMIVQVFTDISYRFKNDHEKEDASSYIQEFEGLVVYSNDCFEKLSKNYNSKKYKIDYLFELSKA